MHNRKIITETGSSHFVTFSTYGRRRLLDNPICRQIVISHLERTRQKLGFRVCGFVIMPDHVHALLWFPEDSHLPNAIMGWKTSSAIWIRKFYEQTAPEMVELMKTNRSGRERHSVWQRRYYDFNVQTREKYREKISYMHFNPVKQKLCARTEDWWWGSAPWYAQHRSVGVKIEGTI